MSQPTVARVRRQYAEEGLEAALNRRAPNRVYARKLDGEQEAQLIALVCGEPPEGYAQWSLRLAAERLVALEIVASISHQTVGRALKETNCSPIASSSGSSHPSSVETLSGTWRMCWRSTPVLMIRAFP